MTKDVPDGLRQWARLPGPTRILTAVRQRLEEGHGVSGRALRCDLTDTERRDVGKLLGTTWELSNRPVRPQALADAIASVGSDLETLLHAVHGPLRDRPAERAARRGAAETERRHARQILVDAGVAAETVDEWLTGRGLPAPGTGHLKRLGAEVAAVLQHLPGPDTTILLGVLATAVFNNPHALDRGSRLATAVLRLAARFSHDGHQSPAETWRTAWESLGVVCDELSSRVLVLNLLLTGTAPACRLTTAADSEPMWLTWRSLTGTITTSQPDVHVCENPAVVAAAADQLGPRSRPLICTNGRPSGAARRLLAALRDSNTQLWVRADDDSAGQDIVRELRTIAPAAKLWRYAQRERDSTHARYEEQDLELLLSDLDAAAQRAP